MNALPSVYSHLLTFIAGAHACIGFRFSVIECVAIIIYSINSPHPAKMGPRRCVALALVHFSLYFTWQDQSPLVHDSARVRVRIGPSGGGHRTPHNDRRSSCDRVESCRGASVAAVDSTGEYGLNAGEDVSHDEHVLRQLYM